MIPRHGIAGSAVALSPATAAAGSLFFQEFGDELLSEAPGLSE